MDITGRIMKGFVWVEPKRCDDNALSGWIALAESSVGKLPAKRKA